MSEWKFFRQLIYFKKEYYILFYKSEKNEMSIPALREKCPDTEFFLVRIRTEYGDLLQI